MQWWRCGDKLKKIKTDAADDDKVRKAIEELENDHPDEYQALKELCKDEVASSLGGLPLALVQAGTYMARFGCSFVEYLSMFKTANRMEDVRDIIRETEEVKQIRE